SNIHEDVNVWVTGDKPSWLNTQEAKHIAHERVSDNPYIDSMHAVKQALEHDDMGNHFILMNDDLYILIPTAVAFLGIPRYFADYTDDLDSFKVVVKYHKLELGDLKALQKRAMPMRNYGLHWPYVFNTDLFLNVYNEFGVDQNPHNMETLYYNSCSELVVPYPGDLLRSNKVVQEGFELHQIPKNVVVLNNKEHGFSQIESLLNQLFPEPCRFES
ncbi:MAG: hypothetical protein HOD87_09700, partial [Gammaproteobacteria bacterium]|nr:hypothetical protein [Gammaproteobacteria bacterium]